MAKPRRRGEKQRARKAIEDAHAAAGVLSGGSAEDTRDAIAKRLRRKKDRDLFLRACAVSGNDTLAIAKGLAQVLVAMAFDADVEVQRATDAYYAAVDDNAGDKQIKMLARRLELAEKVRSGQGEMIRTLRPLCNTFAKLADTEAKTRGDAVNGELQIVAHDGQGMDATFKEAPTVH